MSITHTIRIGVEPAYDVLIGRGLLARCGELLMDRIGLCRLAVITDSNVAPLYLDSVTASLRAAGYDVSSYVFPAGEDHKNLTTLAGILEFLAGSELDRGDCVVALGGGVTGDMAGFAAGCYLRGVRFVQLPTTLLAAVDSSVGGKTAVDLTAGKNLAGLFHQPSAVICDIDCLQTLPAPVLADGMAEAVKTGVLAGGKLFELCQDPQADLVELIARCVAHKGEVVAADEFETGLRQTLNLGHTAGHAIEGCSGYRISHGHAVAMGLALIARAAEQLGWSETGTAGKIHSVLKAHDLPVTTDYGAAQLAEAAGTDKKRSGGDITLVIPAAIGRCVLHKIPVSDLEAVFQAGLEG